jgi:rhomboid protease GluP
MALGGFVCPYCRYFNAIGERTCGRCAKWLPPQALAGPLATLLGTELWATKLLFGINAVMFAAQYMESFKYRGASGFMGSFAMSSLLRFGAITNVVAPTSSVDTAARLLAACFLHMSLLHVGMNMLALADLGRLGEPLVRGQRFLLTYVVTGVFGFLVSTLWYGDAPVITAGASGAVFGLDGMFIALLAVGRDSRWKQLLVRTVLQSFIFYFVMRTNQAAHLGGLLGGGLLGLYFGREKRSFARDPLFNVLALASFVLVLAALAVPHAGRTWRLVRAEEERRQIEGHLRGSEDASPPDSD